LDRFSSTCWASTNPEFHGEIIAELERLRESDTVRVIDSLEHQWAVPLRDAIARAVGYRVGDGFVSPLDLVEIGLMSAEEAKELHRCWDHVGSPAGPRGVPFGASHDAGSEKSAGRRQSARGFHG
jgi:hypothetical protein